jgi:polysaccharide biosynthesis transport protein
MTPRQLFALVRARWPLVLVCLLLCSTAAALISLRLPKSFVATASVVLDVKPDPISPLMYPGLTSPAYMNTQVDVLNSPRVALRVIHDLKLADDPLRRARWQAKTGGQGSLDQWLVPSVQGGLSVKPSRESNVISVAYKAVDPAEAARMANAFVRAYVATSLELRVAPAREYAGYFDSQTQAALDRLEAAKAKLSAFERDKGILATDERLDVETQRLNELSSQLVAMQALAVESSSRQSQAQQSAERLPEVLGNSVVVQLKSELGRAEAQLRELGSRLGDNHPQVIEAKANVGALRARLEGETQRVSGGVTVTSNINQRRVAEVRAALDSQRDKVVQLKSARDEAGVLMREVETTQRAYENISTRLTQTKLESQSTLSNISVLTEASPPLVAAAPNIKLNTLMAALGGLVMGLGLALVLELRDRRVRNADDLTGMLPLPLLGLLPTPPASNSPPAQLGWMSRLRSAQTSPQEAGR